MLHKGGATDNPENYRGLALVNCCAKIFTSIILNRLSQWTDECNILPECQAGFRLGRGCQDNVFTLSSVINLHIRHKKRKLFAIFVDFKRAFDSVDHVDLWNKLFHVGVSSKILRVIIMLYSHATVQIKGSDGLSKSFEVTTGVLQGEPLSPLLFALFIADFDTFFYENGAQGINIDDKNDVLSLIYADDLVILAHSEIDVVKKLKILEKYTVANKLNVNLQKTKIMQFSKGGFRTPNFNFYFNNQLISITNKYTYLGVVFTSSGLFNEMAHFTANKGKQAIGSLLPIMSKAKINTWHPRIKLFESLALSVMFNCISVWGLRYLDVLERVQLYFLKRVLLVPITTPDAIIRLETGRVKFAFNIFKMSLNWIQKIMTMDNHRYPKLCFKQQLRLINSTDIKYNWIVQLKKFFVDIDCVHKWNNLNHPSFSSYRKELFSKYFTHLHDSDVSIASRYPFMYLYNYVPTSCEPSTYLLFKLPIQVTRTLAQLRMSNHFRIKFTLNGISY